MNLTINGYKITLGPRALAHVETMKSPYFEDAAKVYAQNELERWCAGGKVGPDVTVTGPERFVPRYNELGLPMMPKAGVRGPEQDQRDKALTTPVAPVGASPTLAAPADSGWPKWKRDCGFGIARLASPTRGDGVYYRLGAGCEPAAEYWWDDNPWNGAAGVPGPEALAWLRTHGHTKVADELERSTTQAQEFQVWRQEDGSLNIATETLFGSMVLASRINGQWRKEPTDGPDEYVCATRLPEPEEAREIEAAKKAGVL